MNKKILISLTLSSILFAQYHERPLLYFHNILEGKEIKEILQQQNQEDIEAIKEKLSSIHHLVDILKLDKKALSTLSSGEGNINSTIKDGVGYVIFYPYKKINFKGINDITEECSKSPILCEDFDTPIDRPSTPPYTPDDPLPHNDPSPDDPNRPPGESRSDELNNGDSNKTMSCENGYWGDPYEGEILCFDTEYFKGYRLSELSEGWLGLESVRWGDGIELWDNYLSNVNNLTNLKEVMSLDLHSNRLVDIRGLGGLVNIESLNLADNMISDITSLKNIRGIKRLYLNNNNISDISTLSNLNSGVIELDIGGNNISDFTPIEDYNGLISLDISDNHLSDLSILTDVIDSINRSGWGVLDISDNDIIDISALSRLSGLKALYIHGNDIADISPLKNITSVKIVSINDTPYSEKLPQNSWICQNIHAIKWAVDSHSLLYGDVVSQYYRPMEVYGDICEGSLPPYGGNCYDGFYGDPYKGDIICRGKQDIEELAHGWSSLKSIANGIGLNLVDLPKLTDISNLSNLTAITSGDLVIQNSKLTDLHGLENLGYIDRYLKIKNNNDLISLNGISEISFNMDDSAIVLDLNMRLNDISALSGVKKVKYFTPAQGKNYSGKIGRDSWICQYEHYVSPYTDYENICSGVDPQIERCKSGNFSNFPFDSLKCSNMGIDRLGSGWENITNMKHIYLGSNALMNLENLSNLRHVKKLNLLHNPLTDISGLNGVTYIEYLYIPLNRTYSVKLDSNSTICKILSKNKKVTSGSGLGTEYIGYISGKDGVYDKLCERDSDSESGGENYNNSCENGYSGDPYSGDIECRGKSLTSLSPGWLNLKSINGKLNLSSNRMTNIDNLSNLTRVDSIYLYWNKNLTDISPLNNINYVSMISLDNREYDVKLDEDSWICRNFDNIDIRIKKSYVCEGVTTYTCENGFDGEVYEEGHVRCGSKSLMGLGDGWLNLHSVKNGGIMLYDNSLTEISNLSNLTYVNRYLDLSYNNLTSLHGLENLTHVGGYILLYENPNLTDISALNSVTYIEGIYIDNRDYNVKLNSDSWICQNTNNIDIYDEDENNLDSSLICNN